MSLDESEKKQKRQWKTQRKEKKKKRGSSKASEKKKKKQYKQNEKINKKKMVKYSESCINKNSKTVLSFLHKLGLVIWKLHQFKCQKQGKNSTMEFHIFGLGSWGEGSGTVSANG